MAEHPPAAAADRPPRAEDAFARGLSVARELGRRKAAVAVVLLIAIAAGVLVAGRQYDVEVASADVLIDTPSSQVVDLGARLPPAETTPDLDALTTRARLLGNLFAAGALKSAVAERAGIDADDLVVVPPAESADPELAPEPVGTAAALDAPGDEAMILTLAADATLPILRVRAQAPEAETAEALASATAAELEQHLGTLASRERVPLGNRIVVREISSPPAATLSRGPSGWAALAAALAMALLGCAALVAVPRLYASARELAPPRAGAGASGAEGGAGRAGEPRGAPARGPAAKPRAAARSSSPRPPRSAKRKPQDSEATPAARAARGGTAASRRRKG